MSIPPLTITMVKGGATMLYADKVAGAEQQDVQINRRGFRAPNPRISIISSAASAVPNNDGKRVIRQPHVFLAVRTESAFFADEDAVGASA